MGKLFVIDGTDGSGKQTQFNRLQERLTQDHIDYRVVSFPNYDSPSSALVKMYLSGEFGEHAKDISPYIASTFYTVDRYATFQKEYKQYYEKGGIILADRYTTGNMIHQAGKIQDEKQRDAFLNWITDFEFNLFGLPKPTEVFLLKMPPDYAISLIQDRENKFTHQKQKDIHERDKQHLVDSYLSISYLGKKYHWCEIECVENDQVRSIEDIHEEIYAQLKKRL